MFKYLWRSSWQILLFIVNVGHGTADNLMDHFTKSVLESGLQAKNILQVSMDGPSVNWKFYGELKKKVNTDYGTTLKNIGSCGACGAQQF